MSEEKEVKKCDWLGCTNDAPGSYSGLLLCPIHYYQVKFVSEFYKKVLPNISHKLKKHER